MSEASDILRVRARVAREQDRLRDAAMALIESLRADIDRLTAAEMRKR